LVELFDLPRSADAIEAAWAAWDVSDRWRRLRLLLDHVTFRATGKGVRFSPTRLDPRWKL
jgi:hypothetical protein